MAKRNQTEETDFNPDEFEGKDVPMDEVEGEEIPEPFRFENIGDSIAGRYVFTGEVEGEYRKQRIYTIETKSGKRYTVYSNADLLGKMKKVALGSRVHIEFVSEQPMGADLNPRRIFKVRASAAKAGEKSSVKSARKVE